MGTEYWGLSTGYWALRTEYWGLSTENSLLHYLLQGNDY